MVPVSGLFALAWALTAAPAVAAPGLEDADTSVPAEPASDIVVTARFKTENLSDVPVAISVLGAQQLDRSNLHTLDQFQRLTPSLQIQGVNPRNQAITIRGLGANPGLTTEGFESGVGVYMDGVYNARSAVALFDIFDIDRVEVLRGPQGTLFGKNTTAGAISIVSKAPGFTLGGNVEVALGNDGFRQVQASLTGPLTDTLAARVTVGDTRRESAMIRYADGQPFYGLHNQSVRGQLLFKPSDTFSLRLIGDYSYQYQNGPTQVIVAPLPTKLANGATVSSFYQRAANAGYTPVPIDPESRVSPIDEPNYWRMRQGGVSATADLQTGGLRFTSITAYRTFHIRPSYDADYTGAQFYQTVGVPIESRQFTQELRVQSHVGKLLEYTAGLYYFHIASDVVNHVIYGSAAARFLYGPTANPGILNGVDQYQAFNPKTDSYSAFGQATLHITPKLSANGGIRYTYEDKTGSTVTNAGTAAIPISALPADQQATAITARNRLAPTLAYSARWKGGNLSGTAGLSYQATNSLLAFATYSRAFKSAGLNLGGAPANVPRVIAPEHVDSYELGIKASAFDRRLTIDASLFQTNVENYQATVYDSAIISSYIANAGSVRSRGAELHVSAQIAGGLTVGFAGSYTDAYYKSVRNTTCPYLLSYQPSCNINGTQLAGVSRWSGSGTVEYVRPIGRHEVYVGGDYFYRTHFNSSLNNDPLTDIPSYGLLGAHVGIRATDGRWDLSLWGTNLTNTFYYRVRNVNSQIGTLSGMPGDPRYFGARFKVGL